MVDVADIDEMNILQAALKAMEGAVAALPHTSPDYLLVDGNQLPKAFSKACSQTVVRGDSRSTVIAAASILAKASACILLDTRCIRHRKACGHAYAAYSYFETECVY